MWFGVLGPTIVVDEDGADVPLGPGIPRAVLAMLLARANRTVPADRLAAAVWGGKPPPSAEASLRNHVARLRRQLGAAAGERIQTANPGYRIEVRDGESDEQDFADRTRRGHQALADRDWATAAAELGGALALWRGEPYADLTAEAGNEAHVQQLQESQMLAWQARIDADLQLGRHREVVPELVALAARNPVREALHSQLMLALYRSGRQAEAQEVFHTLRRTLSDELAVQPSAGISGLHRRIIANDPGLELAAPQAPAGTVTSPANTNTAAASGVPPTAVPDGFRFQLPADTRAFTGRDAELQALFAAADSGDGTVVITALDGMGGVGKSTLAMHAAHLLSPRFPDGQLFVDLRGNTAGLEPLNPMDALHHLLTSLGVPAQAVPADPASRAAFYRARLAGTRTLIVLDNAGGTAQVRPLLPGSAGCLVLVTSRKRLSGLEDAHLLTVDVLPEAEALVLLQRLVGAERVSAADPAVAELIALCGRLPLAIRMVAARLRVSRRRTVADLVAALRDEAGRLDRLHDDDRDLTSLFESSYSWLPEPEQRLFRRLGLIPGTEVDAPAAAALLGAEMREAERVLESLVDHSLLIEHSPNRYQMHDLVRVFARSVSEREPEGQRLAATDRLFDYYLRASGAAGLLLARYTRTWLPAQSNGGDSGGSSAGQPPGPVAPVQPPLNRDAAQAWLSTERANLLAAVEQAWAARQPERVIGLVAGLAPLLESEGNWQEAGLLHEKAIQAAEESGEALAAREALFHLGSIRRVLTDLASATEIHTRILEQCRAAGDRLGEANAIHELGCVKYTQSDFKAATELFETALGHYRDLDDPRGRAYTLLSLGRTLHGTGDFAGAAALMRSALTEFEGLGDAKNRGIALAILSHTHREIGDYPAAMASAYEALEIFQSLGQRGNAANVAVELCRIRYALGEYRAALELAESALAFFREVRVPLGIAYGLRDTGRIRLALGETPAAITLLTEALTAFEEIGNHLGIANTCHDLGRAHHTTGRTHEAAEYLERANAEFRSAGDRHGEADVHATQGRLALDTSRPDQAREHFDQAWKLATDVGSPPLTASALEGRAHLALLADQREEAIADLREAVAIYERISSPKAAQAAAELARLGDGSEEL
ncbi:tetratricopeptide repeat protein [Catenulispora sp. NF23]|uniref:AfsR/SARP family transcriptional regulator n=1 Tax=Catenulispora pinistramenti TaxID=2705254 RepID=UPI001BA66477|nr:BTAD domain-containing putative transcriptional regulator [Catenulispora pinistramenti]MBS2539724.1 tetratricopeptide repeat protein [Catenulispora pinistramenti]